MEKCESRDLLAITPFLVHVYDGTNNTIASADAARGSSVTTPPSNPIGQNAQPFQLLIADIGSNGDGSFPGQSAVPAPGGGENYAVFIVGEIKVDNSSNPGNQWTFGTFSDDNSRIRIDLDQDGLLEGSLTGNGGIANETVAFQGGCCGAVLGPTVTLPDGRYLIEMVYTEGGGGDYGEFFYAPGNPPFNIANYALLGNDSKGISIDLNEAPVLNNLQGDVGNGGVTYIPNSPAVLLDANPLANVTDADNPPNVFGTTLTIKTTLGAEAFDVVSPKTNGGGNVRSGPGVGGTTTVGSFTGGTGGSDLVITFNGIATLADVSDVLQNITFAITNPTANNPSRLFTWTYDDGQGDDDTVTTTLSVQAGDGVPNVRVWDGNSDFDGDGISWADPFNWQGDIAPDADDIASFTGLDQGSVNLNGNRVIGSLVFTSGIYDITAGSLTTNSISQTAFSSNTISAQIISTSMNGVVNTGLLTLSNSANSLSLLGGTWTVGGGATLQALVNGANSGLGLADVDLTGGVLDLLPGPPTLVNGIAEKIFNGVPFNAQDNIESYRNQPLGASDASGNLFTHLHYPNDASVTSRAAALGAVGFNDGDFAMLWTTTFTPTESGTWGFRFNNEDDNASFWIDTDQNTFLELGNRFYNRGCCGGSGDQFTPFLTAGQSYLLGIVMSDTGGGGNFTDMEYRTPSNGTWFNLDPSTAPSGLFQIQAVAPGNLPNDVRVLNSSEINLSFGLPGATLGKLTLNPGTALTVDGNSPNQTLEFGEVSLAGAAVVNMSFGSPRVTLRNIGETAVGSLLFLGNGNVFLPTANTYSGQTLIDGGVIVNVSANGALGTTAGNTVVAFGGSLQLSSNVVYTTAEPLILLGNGTGSSDAALFSSGNSDFHGPITLGNTAKIRSESGNLRLFGQVDNAGNPLELRADGQMEIWTGLSGAGTITKTGGNRMIMLVNADAGSTFSGQLNINEGIWDARGNNSLGSTIGATNVANNARLELRDGRTLGDNISITGNSGGNGAIRNENNSNTLTGTITLNGASSIHVNDTQLHITGQIVGGQALTKTGTGTLILDQDNILSNFNLAGGEVRIKTVNGLGSTSAVSVDKGEALEFDASLVFNGGTNLQLINANGGAINAISGTTTLDIPINVGIISDLIFGGNGNLIVQQGFGNGAVPVSKANALAHYGYHVNNDGAVMDLNNNGGMVNGNPPNPTAFPNFFGFEVLTSGPQGQGLRYINDADFQSGGAIGQNDNYSDLFIGILHVSPANAGLWHFRINQQDDPTGIWLDINQNGVFESTVAGLGSNRGEQLAWSDTGDKTVNLAAGDYMIAYTHREGGGGSVIDGRFRSPTMGAEAIVNPSDIAQAGLWSTLLLAPDSNVIKNGTGTVTLGGANTYNGETLVNQGVLVVNNPNALGDAATGTTVASGATLGIAPGVHLNGEPLTLNGTGAAGQPGALVNSGGGASIYTGTITAEDANLGSFGIGSDGGTLTVNGSIDMRFSQAVFNGAGSVIVNSTMSGLGASASANGLQHYGYHVNNDGAVMNLNNNGGMMNGTPPNPAGFANFFGTSVLLNGPNNAGLDFNNDNDFINTGNIGQVDNYSNLFLGTLHVTPGMAGNWTFRNRVQDDPTGIWLDLNQDGVFQSNGALNSNQNEQLAWSDTGTKSVFLNAGDYMIAFTHREGGGGSQIETVFTAPGFGSETVIKPGDPAQNGIFLVVYNSNNAVVKNGTGTVTLAGNNGYNGETTINQGVLVAANPNALGTTGVGTTVNSGGTLGFANNVAVGFEDVEVAPNPAPGVDSILNISGNNSLAGNISDTGNSDLFLNIGALAGTLTLNGNINISGETLTFDGAGNVVVNGQINAPGYTAPAYPAAILGTPDVHAYYQMNETSGNTVVDSSGNALNGTYNPNFVLGQPSAFPTLGTAVDFTGGMADLGTAPAMAINNASFTVMTWAYADTLGGDKSIFGTDTGATDQGLHLIVRGTQIYMGFYADDLGGAGVINAGQWYHFAWTYNAATNLQSIYVDGVLNATRVAGGDFQGTTTVHIGQWGGGNRWDGRIDEAAFFSRDLTAFEISTIVNAAPLFLPPVAANIVKNGTGTATFNNANNNYAGTTTINDGVLSVPSFAPNGSNSPLGSGSDVIFGGGTLQYTGAGAASTNRNFSFTGNGFINVSNALGILTPSNPLTPGGNTFGKTGAGTLQLTTAGNAFSTLYAAGGNLVINAPGTTTVSGNLGVGRNVPLGASGTLTVMTNTTVSGILLVGDATGLSGTVNHASGTLQVNDHVRLAHWPNEISTYNLSGSGILNITNGLHVGWDGIGVFNQSGGTLNAAFAEVDANQPADNTHTPAIGVQDDFLNVTGGTFNLGGGALTILGSGSATFGGSSNVVAGNILVARRFNGGTVNFQGNTLVNLSSNLFLGERNSFGGNVNQSGGTVNVGGQVRVGHWPSATSTYTMNNGTLNMTAASPGVNPFGGGEQNGAIYLGVDGTGVLNQSGGIINARALVLDNRGNTGGTDTFTQTAGTLNLGNWGIQGNASTQVNLGGSGDNLVAASSFSISLPIILSGTGANAANFNTNGNIITVNSALSGAGGLDKVGLGDLILTQPSTYGGGTNVAAGRLLVNNTTGSGTGTGTVTVQSGATLGGTGSVSGPVNVLPGGILSPGLSPADFGTGDLTLSTGANYDVEINGPTAGTQYDQTIVTGTVSLNNANLNLALGYAPGPTDVFVLINNDGADSVVGAFIGLPQLTPMLLGGQWYHINYAYDAGAPFVPAPNDVALTPNVAPIADAGNYTIGEGDNLPLDGSGSSDPDGDSLTYRWDVDGDGDFDENITGLSPNVSWATLQGLGIDDGPQTRTIYVEVDDGLGGVTVSTGTLNFVLNNTPPTAGLSGPTEAGVGQPVDFTFTATDPSATDTAALFDYEIDWGDGNIENVNGAGGSINLTHTYTTLANFTVSVTATDQNSGVSAAATQGINVQAVFIDVDGNLVTGGLDEPDRIIFSAASGGKVSVRWENSESLSGNLPKTYGPFTLGSGAKIIAYGGGGDDTITISNLLIPVEFHGGDGNDYLAGGTVDDSLFGDAGNDRLLGGLGNDLIDGGGDNDSVDAGAGNDIVFGGGGNDTLLGGDGNDVVSGGEGTDGITGSNGRDILLGGDGKDSLSGGNDEDVLASGLTAYDSYSAANYAALQALLAEWTSGNTYATRIANLKSGGGAAAGNVLNPGSNVTNDDGYNDILKGATGNDWFLASTAVSGVNKDTTDRASTETLN